MGVHLTKRIWVIPAVYFTQSLDPSSDPFTETGDMDYALVKAEMTVSYTLDEENSMHLTAFDHMMGALTGSGRGLTLGYAMRF